jgi:hypothetical protein
MVIILFSNRISPKKPMMTERRPWLQPLCVSAPLRDHLKKSSRRDAETRRVSGGQGRPANAGNLNIEHRTSNIEFPIKKPKSILAFHIVSQRKGLFDLLAADCLRCLASLRPVADSVSEDFSHICPTNKAIYEIPTSTGLRDAWHRVSAAWKTDNPWSAQKNEHRTSNVQHRTSNEKTKNKASPPTQPTLES